MREFHTLPRKYFDSHEFIDAYAVLFKIHFIVILNYIFIHYSTLYKLSKDV